MSNFIKSNSNYGDIIMMTVRGQATHRINVDIDSSMFNIMRILGIDQLDGCTVFPGF